jgi:hypothetical protein
MRLFRWLSLRARSSDPDQSPATTGGEAIPRYPPFLRGLPAASVAEVVATQRDLVAELQDALAFTDRRFGELVVPVIERYAAFVHLLPASETHHHRGAGGRFRHGLEVACHAARASRGMVFALDHSPGDRRELEPRWPGRRSRAASGCRSTSSAGRSAALPSRVSSRTSPAASVSGFPRIASHLTGVGLAKTDHPDAVRRLGEAQHVQPAFQEADCHVPRLPVVATIVDRVPGAREVEAFDTIEREAPLSLVAGAPDGVAGDLHVVRSLYKKLGCGAFCSHNETRRGLAPHRAGQRY